MVRARRKKKVKAMDKEQYEKDLQERQRRHLENVGQQNSSFPFQPAWKPCLHDQCQSCHGTGVTITGASCVHGISCDCPKCAVSYCQCVNAYTTPQIYEP